MTKDLLKIFEKNQMLENAISASLSSLNVNVILPENSSFINVFAKHLKDYFISRENSNVLNDLSNAFKDLFKSEKHVAIHFIHTSKKEIVKKLEELEKYQFQKVTIIVDYFDEMELIIAYDCEY